ncbi:unnamed protein product [Clavelina lepadiformis]|uniref:Mitochondrial ribosomal protein L55 n=1 Tax=Clavelina lepadiformis TaxID=159417 RepID=A0ABP0FQ12_CLALP
MLLRSLLQETLRQRPCVVAVSKNVACRDAFSGKTLAHQFRHNSQRCMFGKQTRTTYPRMYKTKLFLQDGSTITIRTRQPKQFIRMPIDMPALPENEQKRLWLMRKETVRTVEDVDVEDDFDASEYRKFIK